MTSPITPPDELVQKWINEEDGLTAGHIATQAAQWGWEQRGAATECELQQRADQELDACCLLLDSGEHAATYGCHDGTSLRAARRPTPPSEADQALADLDALVADLSNHGMGFKTTNLRRALERLKELEGQGND